MYVVVQPLLVIETKEEKERYKETETDTAIIIAICKACILKLQDFTAGLYDKV